MRNNIDLHISDSSKDYINIFIVYRLHSNTTNHGDWACLRMSKDVSSRARAQIL